MPPTTVRKTIRLHRAQSEFRHSRALYRAFTGGRSAGKTWVGAYDLIRRAERGRTYMVVGPTYTSVRDSTMRTFLGVARELNVLDPSAVRTSAPPELTLSTGAEILFRSGDDPEKLRGPSLAGAWLDEASLMHRDVFDIMIATLRDHGRQGWLSATFTPKGPTHWTAEIWSPTDPKPNTHLVRAPTYANPFNPPGFADTLRQQYDDQFAAQEIEGEFIDLEGAEWPAHYFRKEVWFEHWLPDSEYVLTVIGLDPSRGRDSKAGDYAAYVVARLDRQGVVWLDAVLVREDVPRLVARGCELARQYPGCELVCETNIGQELLVGEFKRAMLAAGVMFPVSGYENRVPKVVRIRRLGPYLAHGRIRLRATQGGKQLGAQLQGFPNTGINDDGPDAAELAIRRVEERVSGRR